MREPTGRILTFFFVATLALGAGLAHGQRKPGSPLDHLPANIEILTRFGERPDFSPDNRQIAFMAKSFGDAFVLDLEVARAPLPHVLRARRVVPAGDAPVDGRLPAARPGTGEPEGHPDEPPPRQRAVVPRPAARVEAGQAWPDGQRGPGGVEDAAADCLHADSRTTTRRWRPTSRSCSSRTSTCPARCRAWSTSGCSTNTATRSARSRHRTSSTATRR